MSERERGVVAWVPPEHIKSDPFYKAFKEPGGFVYYKGIRIHYHSNLGDYGVVEEPTE